MNPEAQGNALTEAQQQYARLVADSALHSTVLWRLDPGNAGLLSRSLPLLASRGIAAVEIEIAAQDRSETHTDIPDESSLIPLVRHLQARAAPSLQLRFRLSVGRPYVLPPAALDLSTTNRCGLACAMCGSRSAEQAPDQLSQEEVLSLLDQAAHWGLERVALTGAGEPFGDPHMVRYLEYAAHRSLRATVTTNGTPVTETLASVLAQLPISVSVSIHGASDQVHDRIVGVPGSRSRAWTALRRLLAARDRLSAARRFTVSVSSVIQRDNLDELGELVRLSLEEGCDGHNLQPINLQRGALRDGRIVQRSEQERGALLSPSPEDAPRVQALFDTLESFAESHPGHLHASRDRLVSLREHLLNRPTAPRPPCNVGSSFLGVDHRGQIRPCYRVPWRLGSVRANQSSSLWNSQAYHQIRDLMAHCPLTCLNNCFFRSQLRSPAS